MKRNPLPSLVNGMYSTLQTDSPETIGITSTSFDDHANFPETQSNSKHCCVNFGLREKKEIFKNLIAASYHAETLHW